MFRLWSFGRTSLLKCKCNMEMQRNLLFLYKEYIFLADFVSIWNISSLMVFIYYQCFFIYMTVSKIIEYDVPIASSIMILMEMVIYNVILNV